LEPQIPKLLTLFPARQTTCGIGSNLRRPPPRFLSGSSQIQSSALHDTSIFEKKYDTVQNTEKYRQRDHFSKSFAKHNKKS